MPRQRQAGGQGEGKEALYPSHANISLLRPPLAPLGCVAKARHSPRYDSLPRLAQAHEEHPRKTKYSRATGIPAGQTGPARQAGPGQKAERSAQTEATLEQAIAADPGSSLAHARLAVFYLTRERTDDAIAEFQEAITHDPENAKLFVGLAIAYLHRRSYSMAQAMVERALELDPKLANARKLGEYIDARQLMLAKVHAGGRSGQTAGSLPAAADRSRVTDDR